MQYFRASYRLVIMLGIVALNVRKTAKRYNQSNEASLKKAKEVMSNCFCKLLDLLGVEVEVEGVPPEKNVIYVSNHRSYLDGLIIGSLTGSFFVIKSETARWFLLGNAIKKTANIFVNRNSLSDRTASGIKVLRRVRSGFSVCIFPEGTTCQGPGCREMHDGIFRLAAKAGITVVPVTVEYERPDVAWLGDDRFVSHFLRCFGVKNTKAKIKVGPGFASTDAAYLKKACMHHINTASLRIYNEFRMNDFTPCNVSFTQARWSLYSAFRTNSESTGN